VGSVLVGQKLEADGIDSHADHVEFAGGAEGEVDDAVGKEDAAVGDGDDDRPPVAQVGDLDLAAEGQGAVGGGELVHVETPSAGGEVSLEDGAVPAGKAAFDSDEAGEDGGPGGGDGVDDVGRGDVVRHHRNHRGSVRRSRGCRGGDVCRKG